MTLYRIVWLRHGVITRTAPRMTTAYPLHSQPTPFKGTMLLQRLHGILAAGGGVAAGSREMRRYSPLIKANQQYKNL